MRTADPTPPHPEEHREAVRLEGWEPVMLLPTLRDAAREPLLRVRLSGCSASHERHYGGDYSASSGALPAMSSAAVAGEAQDGVDDGLDRAAQQPADHVQVPA